MKEIKAIVRPFMVEKVLDALEELDDLPGVTISEIMGWGRLPGRREDHDVSHSGHGFSKKVKLEIVVHDELAERVALAIVSAARTGKPGDGKVFTSPVEDAIRVRTGEAGDDAL